MPTFKLLHERRHATDRNPAQLSKQSDQLHDGIKYITVTYMAL